MFETDIEVYVVYQLFSEMSQYFYIHKEKKIIPTYCIWRTISRSGVQVAEAITTIIKQN